MTTLERPTAVVEPELQPGSDLYDLSKIQERHPDWPKIELSFYFSGHGSAEDIEGIAPYLADADVLLYEESPRSAETLLIMNEISVSPDTGMAKIDWDVTKHTHGGPLVEGIKGTQKGIATIDIGKNEYENELSKKIMRLLTVELPRHIEYDDAITLWRNSYAEAAVLQNKREDIMIDNFEGEINDLLQTRPDLKERETLKVLVQMGSYHTRLGHGFAKSGLKSDRHFPTMPYVYDYNSELQRSFTFGKEPSRELVERAIAEVIIWRYAETANPEVGEVPFHEIDQYIRAVASKLSRDDMKDLYDAYSEGYLSVKLLDRLLSLKDLYRLPRSNEELFWIMDTLQTPRKKALATTAMRA